MQGGDWNNRGMDRAARAAADERLKLGAYHEAGHFTAAHILCEADRLSCCVLGVFLEPATGKTEVSLRFHKPTKFEPVAIILLAGIVAEAIAQHECYTLEVDVDSVESLAWRWASGHAEKAVSDIQRLRELAEEWSGDDVVDPDTLTRVLRTSYPLVRDLPRAVWDGYYRRTFHLLRSHWRGTGSVASALLERQRLFPHEAEEAFMRGQAATAASSSPVLER